MLFQTLLDAPLSGLYSCAKSSGVGSAGNSDPLVGISLERGLLLDLSLAR
jgi:hypothetical protein